MKVRKLLLGLVGAAIGWLEPGGDDVVDLVSREGRRAEAAGDEIVGSPASGYRSEGSQFYTWQPEREEVAAWVAELAPWDHPPGSRDRADPTGAPSAAAARSEVQAVPARSEA